MHRYWVQKCLVDVRCLCEGTFGAKSPYDHHAFLHSDIGHGDT